MNISYLQFSVDWPLMTSKDDRKLDEQSADIIRYNVEGNDLSAKIAQGQRLRDLRSLTNISPSDLADTVGLTLKELLALEAGLMTMRKAQALRLSGALGVKFSDIWLVEDAR